ncbi:hypothetical protein PSHT_06491 [Puccinia striiformis]|uniref:Uncharacterized protein n=1 Tax=Puccinia striiformis TaxID=27350 RepID=A0A2S4W5X2_9BASI|nr:hypothetical protein PSHT_06491 [Puccinia striiformis]
MRPPNGYQANSPTDAGKSTTNEDDGEETGVENSANRPVKRLLRDEEDEEEEERKTRFLDPQRACTRVTHTLKGHSRSISKGSIISTVEFLTKLMDGEEVESRQGINDLAWTPDSEYLEISRTFSLRLLVQINPITVLISGSFDETIKVWDFLGGNYCVLFLVIVKSRMWDTTSGQCLKTMVVAQETNAPVTFITFTPNSRYLITCSLDSTVRIWDYRSKEGTVVKSYTGHSNVKYSIPARVVSLTSNDELDNTIGNDLVLMGSEDGSLYIWDLQSRELVSRKSSSHQDSIIGISIHPIDSSIFATAGIDKDPTIKICSLSLTPHHQPA